MAHKSPFEEAFMRVAVRMVQGSITADTLLRCTMGLIDQIKGKLESEDFEMDDDIGPLLTYKDLHALGPFWYNSKSVQSELITLLVGMLIGDMMGEYISPQEMQITNVFALTQSVDNEAKTAKNSIGALLIEKYGDGRPKGDLNHSKLNEKLDELMQKVAEDIAPSPSGESFTEHLMGMVEEIVERVEAREKQERDQEPPSGKTLH